MEHMLDNTNTEHIWSPRLEMEYLSDSKESENCVILNESVSDIISNMLKYTYSLMSAQKQNLYI